MLSASTRISKGQGYRGFLRKKEGAVLAKKGTRKNLEKWTEFHSF
jgi:hypothetical protein